MKELKPFILVCLQPVLRAQAWRFLSAVSHCQTSCTIATFIRELRHCNLCLLFLIVRPAVPLSDQLCHCQTSCLTVRPAVSLSDQLSYYQTSCTISSFICLPQETDSGKKVSWKNAFIQIQPNKSHFLCDNALKMQSKRDSVPVICGPLCLSDNVLWIPAARWCAKQCAWLCLSNPHLIMQVWNAANRRWLNKRDSENDWEHQTA